MPTPLLPLRSVAVREFDSAPALAYPFSLPLIQARPEIVFDAPVTFFVGENGSGKSTLIEAIACAINLPTVGAVDVAHDATLAPARALGDALTLAWSKKTQRGLFLRAEDFFGFVKREAETRAQMLADRADVDRNLKGSSDYARGLAKGVYTKQINELVRRYGDGIDTRSHGESFLDFFMHRFVPNGLYLLDEPEAPLSPQRQLTLLALLKQTVAQGAQFIIASHSPILMAFPGATILEFAGSRIAPVAYEDTEHYRVTSTFLKNPSAFLDRL
jgi:predicted ATPase